jgi:transcriptional regulator with XRE-family HTH domain
MDRVRLKSARRTAGWTQAEAASRLGVSQPYYLQLECGTRPLSADIAASVVQKFHLSPVTLPLPALDPDLSLIDPSELASQLAGFGYPGFAYLPKPS